MIPAPFLERQLIEALQTAHRVTHECNKRAMEAKSNELELADFRQVENALEALWARLKETAT